MKLVNKKITNRHYKIKILGFKFSISRKSFLFPLILKPKISVIVPVYNVDKYLSECLESIINQSFARLRIICINDGSTDNSLEILKKYHQKDKRIKIINQKNQGLSAARNTGLKYVKSKYVMFIDSDDWIKQHTLSKIYKHIEEKRADFCIFNYNLYTNNKIVPVLGVQKFYGKKQNDVFSYKSITDKLFFRFAVWQKIFRTSFLVENNLQFPVGKIYEDVIFHTKCTIKASRICIYDEDFYYYRMDNASSIMNTSKNSEKNIHIVDAVDMCYTFLKQENILTELKPQFCSFVVRETFAYLRSSPSDVKELLARKISSWLDVHNDIKEEIVVNRQNTEYINSIYS